MSLATADLHDAHAGELQVAEPVFRDFGAHVAFHGPVTTVEAPDDNSFVRAALEEPGEGRVLVVDGGGSTRCALLGDMLAALARDNGWAGVVVHGCIRDAAVVATVELGVKALATCPAKSDKQGRGRRDVELAFAGVHFAPGQHLYADADGIVVAENELQPTP